MYLIFCHCATLKQYGYSGNYMQMSCTYIYKYIYIYIYINKWCLITSSSACLTRNREREREREGCVGIPSIGGAKQKAILIRAFGVFEY
jgi:hypothetical protein